jgi:hypothetical protein
MKRNVEWHLKNYLPLDSTIDQRVQWHIDHARKCPCPSIDADILEEMKKRYTDTHQEFWIYFNVIDHHNLAIWAADCAEHVLNFFEEKYSQDFRPRDAIRTLREWVETGNFSMPIIRGASLTAHAAAREVKKTDDAARFAARAAGQAVATAHVPTHAFGVAIYAIKAVAVTNPSNVEYAVSQEREWQIAHMPKNLMDWVVTGLKQNERLLPKNLRINNIN